MNIVASNHNRLLAGNGGSSPVEYSAGPNINITDRVISGKYWDDEIASAAAAAVDSAFDKSTAWVEEQNYLTAHQDVSNLPYVQNSALEFNGALISGISGSGFYAVSADLANSASESERAISATVSQEAVHAGSADYSREAFHSTSADIAEGANHAESADFVLEGWEYNENNNITGYNGSAFAGGQGGQYEGISPIVVNNNEMKISAESARLGVQDPLYFVEDSNTATVIGIHDSAFPTFEGTEDGKISAINGSAINAASVVEYSAGNNIDITNHVISVTGSVPSADKASTANSATYDSSGNNIANTYLKITSYKEYSAGPNIDITNHVISGRDWDGYIRNIAQSGDATAYNAATAWVYNQGFLTGDYIPVSAMGIDTPIPGSLTYITGFSGSGISARVAAESFTALKDSDGRSLTALLANSAINSADGYVTGIDGTPISGVGGQGVEYEGIAPIVVNNVEHKISAQSAKLGVQEPLYFVEDSVSATVIGISGLPEVEGLMYESALNFGDGYITGYNSSAFSAERAGYAVSATSADTCRSVSNSAGWDITPYSAGSNIDITNHVVSGKDWSTDIQNASSYAYNQATALIPTAEGKSYNVVAGTNVSVTTATASTGSTFTVSSKNWSTDITNASSYAYNQSTAYTTSYVNGQLPSTIPLQAGPNVKIYMSANKVTISAGEFTGWDYYNNGLNYITANNVGNVGFRFNPGNLFNSYTLQQWTYNETRIGVNVYAVKFGATMNNVVGTQWSDHTGVFTLSKGNFMEINEFNCGDGWNNTQISILHDKSWSTSVRAILRDIRNTSTADNNTFTLYYTAIVGT